MGMVITDSSLAVWHDLVQSAENRCSLHLKDELESYLVSLLMRYLNKPEVAKKVFAVALMEALQQQEYLRTQGLLDVGDQCLLYAGLFPRSAEKKRVKVVYFVDIGRAAYSAVSKTTNDIFSSLSMDFVVMMDILQSIGLHPDLLPLEAYEQWNELGSKRSLQILREYSNAIPFKHLR